MSPRTLQLSDTLHAYLLAHGVREPDVAAELRQVTQDLPEARMQISPEQGQLMDFLVRALGVRRAIEVGTYTGYSALRVAMALPPDGQLICCDISQETTDVGKPFWEKADVDHKIDLRIAPAEKTLTAMLNEGQGGTFDWMFIDADKTGYATYVDLGHALLRPGGVIAIDNVLWSGSVADPEAQDDSTIALKELNTSLAVDPRWDLVMLPIGDGCTLLRKRAGSTEDVG